MAELTIDQIMQKLIGEFRSTIRADLRRIDAETEKQNIIANQPDYPIISTKAQFEDVYTYNQALKTAEASIQAESITVYRNSRQIHQQLSNNNFNPEQIFRIPFDNDTTVDVRIVLSDGKPTIDHSLDPDSPLYAP